MRFRVVGSTRTVVHGALAMSMLLCPLVSRADLADKLEHYVGYTIAKSTTITGYRDKEGKKSDDFEGCDFDRRIFLDDGTVLTCQTYSYTYSYRPTAVIMVKSMDIKGIRAMSVVMIVDDEVYDMEAIILKQ